MRKPAHRSQVTCTSSHSSMWTESPCRTEGLLELTPPQGHRRVKEDSPPQNRCSLISSLAHQVRDRHTERPLQSPFLHMDLGEPGGGWAATGFSPSFPVKLVMGGIRRTNYCTTALISHASKLTLKILQARLQQHVNQELPDVQAGFRKWKEPEIKLPTSFGSLKKQESSRKTSTSVLLMMPKALVVWITTNCGKFWKRWEYQTTWPASWEICMQVKKQQLELDVEQQTCSKLGKDYVEAVYCHPTYLTYMQSASCTMLGWMKHKLESRSRGEITSDTHMTPLLWQKAKKN